MVLSALSPIHSYGRRLNLKADEPALGQVVDEDRYLITGRLRQSGVSYAAARYSLQLGIDAIEATDDHTVVVKYRAPYGPALSSWTVGIIPKHIYDGAADNALNGPFWGMFGPGRKSGKSVFRVFGYPIETKKKTVR